MCICINCARVTNCKAYHFVETKHEQPHLSEEPTFEPLGPTIHVNIRTITSNEDLEKEMARMWREHESETKAALQEQQQNYNNYNFDDDNDGDGREKYEVFSPTTTTEYDVVKCTDYIHEAGSWVRNMPKEIKEANPNFVPS